MGTKYVHCIQNYIDFLNVFQATKSVALRTRNHYKLA